jgi:hypothetical protein
MRDPSFLSAYVGQYRFQDRVLDVVLTRNQLVLTVPGQTPYTLLPQIDGAFVLDTAPSIGVRFVPGAERAAALQLLQPNGIFEAPRVTP